MDIAALSMGLAQTSLLNDVGTAVLSNTLEQARSTGSDIVEMLDASAMERSVYPELGGNIDVML